jgi:uroporphyrinogen-III decarboxylase
MTPRERIEAAFLHREPDRTPVFEYVMHSPMVDAFLERPFVGDPDKWPAALDELGWEAAVEQLALDRLDLACALGHDMMYVTPNPMPGQRDIGAHIPATVQSPDPVAAVRKRNEDTAAALAPPSAESALIYTILKQEMQRRDTDLPIMAPAYAHGVWTDVDLMMAMLLSPETAHRHFALATQQALARIEQHMGVGVDIIGIGGDFAGNRPLISPQAYREFIVPQVRTCARRIHEAGRWAINASDGDLWPVIEDFLIGCEVDGYLEIDMHAGMDLRRLKQAYGDRITFLGNLDCGNTLSFGSTEEVRRHVTECLQAGQGNGGHILCASNAITASVPLENYLSLVNAYRDFFGLPRI